MRSDHRQAGARACAALIGFLIATSPTMAATGQVGDFDGHGDVGAPKRAGSARYDAAQQRYTISASGANMWGERDELHFVWKRMKGDFAVQARLRFEGQGDPYRKAGVIVRASLEPDAPYADAALHGNGLTGLQFRRAKGATTEEVRSEVTGAEVLKLERKGNRLTMSAARVGAPDAPPSEVKDLALGEDVYVGLFVCAHNPDVVETVVFENVRLTRPEPDSSRP